MQTTLQVHLRIEVGPTCLVSSLEYLFLVLGFHGSIVESLLFIRKVNGRVIILLKYVDDILIKSSHIRAISSLLVELGCLFAMKEFRSQHFFLGLMLIVHLHLYIFHNPNILSEQNWTVSSQ